MSETLSVRLGEKPVGQLRLNSGSMVFNYDESKRALSLSMPVRQEPYTNRACEAFFGGLLPEALETKKLIARLYGLRSNSSFSLLSKIGFDCAGAVSVTEPSEPLRKTAFYKLEGHSLSQKELHKHLQELPKRPLFAGVDGVRISLAGVQDKAALCLIDGTLSIPLPDVPTTHILKPPIRGLEGSVENEYLCMVLAKNAGLKTANVQLNSAGDINYLLVERFDRHYEPGPKIKRIHQEDFCQALGVVSTKKYEADGGPTLVDCFDLLNQVTYPGVDRLELVRRVVFNYLVGNADCHAKNFSIIHFDDGQIVLSPTYDVMCTSIYSHATTKMAMSIGGRADMNTVRADNWSTLCSRINIRIPAFKTVCESLIKNVQSTLPAVLEDIDDQGYKNSTVISVAQVIEQRAKDLMRTLDKIK
jgi:serine/threonine-protein kinase HipA